MNNRGFTLIEILVVLALVGMLIAITTGLLNYSGWMVNSESSDLVGSFESIDTAYLNYVNDKNTAPTGLNDATFVPTYLFPPIAPSGFDRSYGVSGFNLGSQTGQAAPNNGDYVCARAIVSGAGATEYKAIKAAALSMPSLKFFYNTSCPSVSNMADPGGTATVYVTNWFTRW